MSTLYIEEFQVADMGQIGQVVQAARQPSVARQAIAFTGTAGTSAAFNAKTNLVRIHADSLCSYAFGTAPVATTAFPRLAAGVSEYFQVNPLDKVSAITNV